MQLKHNQVVHKNLVWALYLVPLVYIASMTLLTYTLIQSDTQYQYNQVPTLILNYVYTNLNSKTIKLFNTTDTCSEGYHQIDIGFWVGINEGCLCMNGQTHPISYCYASSAPGCVIIDQQPTKPLKYWNHKQIFCAKYSDENTLIGLTITPGKDLGICLNPLNQHTFESGQIFPLNNILQSGCDQYSDIQDNFKIIENQNARNIYENNNIQLNKIQYYNKYLTNKDTLSLQSEYKLQLPQQCAKHIFPKFQINNTLTQQLIRYIFLITSIFFIGFILLFYNRVYLLQTRWQTLNHTKLIIFISIIVSILHIFEMVFIYYYEYLDTYKMYGQFQLFHVTKCFTNKGINKALKETLNMIRNENENNILVMKTMIFVTLLYIFCELILIYNKRKLRYPYINNPW